MGQLLAIYDTGAFQALWAQPMTLDTQIRLGRLMMQLRHEAESGGKARFSLFNDDNSITLDPGMRRLLPGCETAYFEALQPLLAEEVIVHGALLEWESVKRMVLTGPQTEAIRPLLQGVPPQEFGTPAESIASRTART